MKVIKKINNNIFRGYDIRGIYNETLDVDISYTIGRSYATILKNKYNIDKCIVGEDARSSSSVLSRALIQGINDSGTDVIYLGVVTSPMVYYASEVLNIHSTIIVTASHNPKEYNGFKIAFDEKGEICGDEIVEFKRFTLSSNFVIGKGKVTNYDIKTEYVNMMIQKFRFNNKIKVVIDSGNATPSLVVKDIFNNLNLDVIYIYCDLDSNFPNHHPDPAEKENMIDLQKKVIEHKADIGIAFDGDGDRVGFVDNIGRIVPSDYFLAIMSKHLIPTLPNKHVIFDVSCSKTLCDEVKKVNGIPVMFKTGSSYIKKEMKKQNILLGGEISGHIFFKDKFYGFDDGIYSGLRMIELLDNSSYRFSDLVDCLVKYYSTPVLKIDVCDDKKQYIVNKVIEYCIENNYKINTIDGVRVEFDDSFAIIRKSNTTPKLTIRFEAETEDKLNKLKAEFLTLVNNLIEKLGDE